MSKWKPGQLITIEGKIYRIRKKEYGICSLCAFLEHKCYYSQDKDCLDLIPYNCYYEQVYPKT